MCHLPVLDIRYVVDPATNEQQAVKVFYYFPVSPFLQSLYSRPDLVPFLYHDGGDDRPEGHVSRSRGWYNKVTNNPVMNKDHRNIGLVGTTDGVPLFDDQKRGCWPYILRCLNLPSITHDTRYVYIIYNNTKYI
jgi:hypothetical protein